MQTVVDRLMDEIYEIELDDSVVLLSISLIRGKKYPLGTVGHTTSPAYTAMATIHPQMDISAKGRTPEEALEVLKAGVIGQYAPDHKPASMGITLPVESRLPNGTALLEWGRMYVEVPRVIEGPADCGCHVHVMMSIDSHEENGTIGMTPTFHWCGTHERAYLVRQALKDELDKLIDQFGTMVWTADMFIAATDRVEEIQELLGEGDDD